MGRKIIKSLWNRQNLLDINDNFTELYEDIKNATINVSEEFKKRIEEYENKEIEDNSILGDKITDNTITPEKTNFIRNSKNLFNSNDILNDQDKKDSLKEGDKVIYSQYAGTDVKIDDENYVVLAYKDVLAVVE